MMLARGFLVQFYLAISRLNNDTWAPWIYKDKSSATWLNWGRLGIFSIPMCYEECLPAKHLSKTIFHPNPSLWMSKWITKAIQKYWNFICILETSAWDCISQLWGYINRGHDSISGLSEIVRANCDVLGKCNWTDFDKQMQPLARICNDCF